MLSSSIQAYTDGYKARLLVVLGDQSMPATTGLSGVCIGTSLTTSAAPSGAYCLTWISAASVSPAGYSERPDDAAIAGYWFTKAQWAALSSTFDASTATDLSTQTYYDFTRSPAWTVDDEEGVYIDGAIIWGEFYMPSDVEPEKGEEESVDATSDYGDRLNEGDLVGVIGLATAAASNTMKSCATIEDPGLILGASLLTVGASLTAMTLLLS